MAKQVSLSAIKRRNFRELGYIPIADSYGIELEVHIFTGFEDYRQGCVYSQCTKFELCTALLLLGIVRVCQIVYFLGVTSHRPSPLSEIYLILVEALYDAVYLICYP